MLKSIKQNQSNVKIYLCVSCYLQCTADLRSWLDWQWKTTTNWPFSCWSSSNGTKVTASSLLRSAVLFSFQLIWDHCWISLERVPQIDPSQIEIISYRELNQHKIFTKPYQTKPNQIWTFLWGGNLIVSNFYLWYFLFHALLDMFFIIFWSKNFTTSILRDSEQNFQNFQNNIWF